MADTKTSALTALAGTSVATDDVLAIVDTSVTTTKKIQADEMRIAMYSVPATQAQMEAASSLVTSVTPGAQHYHLGHPKAVIIATSLGSSPFTATALYNSLSTLTPSTNGTGDWTLTWTNTLTNPVLMFSVQPETTTAVRRYVQIRNGGISGTACRFTCFDESGTSANPTAIYIAVYGDLA